MFTKKITDDDNFMSLSASAQALYFHLSMSADDDGFCNQISTAMFKAHASIQDLEALLTKRYVYQFDNGVIVIKHWRMANALRKDRYTPTAFQEELKKLKLKDNGAYTLNDENDDLVAERLPSGCQVVATGKDSIDKNSIDNIDISSKNSIDYQKIIDLYHTNCPSLPKVTKITDARKKLINARLKDYSEDDLEKAFKEAEASDFLTGRNGKWGGASFDWIMNTNNIVKILEGNYKNKPEKRTGFNANQGIISSGYDFAALEAEVKNRGQT